MEFKTLAFEATDIDLDNGFIKGYCSVTGNIDDGDDTIPFGAFRKTITERGTRIKGGWQHDLDMPFAKTTAIREVPREELPQTILDRAPNATGGLYVEGKVSLNSVNRDRLQLVKDGLVDEMSIGYVPVQERFIKAADGRRIRELSEIKLFEWSCVTLGMNPAAQVTEAKRAREAAEVQAAAAPVATLDPIDELLLELKAGRRNSRPDEAKLKAAHDHIHDVLNMPHHDMQSQTDAEDAADDAADEAAEDAKKMALLHQRLTMARSGAALLEVA